MTTYRSSQVQQSANAPAVRGARALAPWRFWTTLVTIIAFTLLLSNVSNHHHDTTADDQECAVCSVVSHKVSDLPGVVLPQLVLVLLSYAAHLSLKACAAPVSFSLLPPSCGPPAGV